MKLKTLESRYKALVESGMMYGVEMCENSLRAGRSICGRLCERVGVWLIM
jgi:hypothetical protein